MNRAFYIKRNGLFVPDRCGMNPAFIGSTVKKPASGGGGGGGSQYTLIGHASAGFGVGEATTTPFDSTGANLFIGFGSWFTGSPSGPTDSASNTWNISLSTFSDGSGNYHQKAFYVINPTTNASHVFNFSASFLIFQIAAFAVAGRTPVFDSATGYNHPASESDSSFQTGSITPGADDALIVTAATWNNTVTAGPITGYSIIEQHEEASDAIFAALAWKAQTTASPENPTWPFSGAITAAAANILAFK